MKRAFIILAAVCICSLGKAQTIDQTVEVTNDYLSSPVNAVKNSIGMFIPDTVMKFNLDFDYDVFENPYEGAYEFSPYSVKFTPSALEYDGRKFYLKAGLGYTMHPVLDAVLTPVRDSAFALAVYQKLNGFFGTYVEGFRGFHFKENLGFAGHRCSEKSTWIFDAGYKGFFNKMGSASSTHSLYAEMGLKSSRNSGVRFFYDFDLGYNFISDYAFQKFPAVNGHKFYLKGTVGPAFGKIFKLLVDLDLDFQKYSGLPETETSIWKSTNLTADNVTPRFCLSIGPLDLSAGANLSFGYDGSASFKVHPDIRADVKILNILKVYASMTGGTFVKDYASIKDEDSWYFDVKSSVQWIQKSRRDVDLRGGVQGRIGTGFGFDVNYVQTNVVNGMLPDMNQYYCYRNYLMRGANVSANWHSERIAADMAFHYRVTDIMAQDICFDLPRFSGSVWVEYNYAKRLYVALSAKGSTGRYAFVDPMSKTSDEVIPQFVNLGVNAKFFITKKFAVWFDASNLLGHRLTYHYGISENGRAFTGGIILNL